MIKFYYTPEIKQQFWKQKCLGQQRHGQDSLTGESIPSTKRVMVASMGFCLLACYFSQFIHVWPRLPLLGQHGFPGQGVRTFSEWGARSSGAVMWRRFLVWNRQSGNCDWGSWWLGGVMCVGRWRGAASKCIGYVITFPGSHATMLFVPLSFVGGTL